MYERQSLGRKTWLLAINEPETLGRTFSLFKSFQGIFLCTTSEPEIKLSVLIKGDSDDTTDGCFVPKLSHILQGTVYLQCTVN